MNWIVCPVISTAQKAAYGLDDWISSTLNAPIDQTFDSNYYPAWNSFRILATAIIVIAGLIMVVSQALGFEALDAYTVRKTLPRLLVAIIGISLSWPLMKFVVEFFNVFGKDVYGLITGPFMEVGSHLNPVTGGLITVLTPIAVGATLFIFGPAALLVILSGLIGLFMAFLILIVRQIGITVLVILAPIAIACYILPGTQKAWGLWRENFLGLLMMFPIVMAFIAGGHAFAAVSIEHGGGLSTIIGIIAYFIPYFLLPMAFKMATGAIGTIAGMVNDRSKGVFDRMKGFRQNAAQQRHQMRMAGQISKGRTGNLYRRLGSVNTPNSGALSFSRKGRARYADLRQQRAVQVAGEALKNDNGRAAGDDIANEVAKMRDTTTGNFVSRYANRAIAAATERGEELTQAQAESQARSAMGMLEHGYGAQVGSSAMRVAAFMAQQNSVTGYDQTDEGVAKRFNDAHQMVADGLLTSSDAMAVIKQNKARIEASGVSFGTGRSMIEKGGITQADVETMLDTTTDGLTPSSLIGARKEAGIIIARHLKRRLDAAYVEAAAATTPEARARAEKKIKQQLGHIAGVQDTINSQAPQMARGFADGLMSQTPEGTAGTTVREEVEALRTMQDPDFENIRKEWHATPPGAIPPGGPAAPTPEGG